MRLAQTLAGRGVYPTEALPGVCPSRELRFNHMSGFANIPVIPPAGAGGDGDRECGGRGAWGARPVHGQLQVVTPEEFERVKGKEGGYVRGDAGDNISAVRAKR